jgi:dihydrofolate reductase
MRKVTAGLFHSIDGVVEAPDQWQFDAFDDELGAYFGQFLGRTDAAVLGRVGYENWSVDFAPEKGDDFFGPFINSVPKYIASKTLKGPLAWPNSTLIKGDVPAFVRELKSQDGKEIAVMGGISIVRSLFLAGVIDELTLITHPVIAGSGRRHLFEAGDPVTRLELKDEVRTSKGNVIATYGLRA